MLGIRTATCINVTPDQRHRKRLRLAEQGKARLHLAHKHADFRVCGEGGRLAADRFCI